MMNFSGKQKTWIMAGLIFMPALYVFLGAYIHQMIGLYSLRSADPEYIYFISGLSVAAGKLELGHIDNPGTPLQYLTALVFRAVYLLRSHQTPFLEDVLGHPDMYLRVLNIVLTAVVGGFMFWAGKKALEITNKLSYSVAIQASPFFTSIIFGNIGRITPENLLPIPVMLLVLLLLRVLYSEDQKYSLKDSVSLGLIAAFGLSIKLTYFPLWIIPLIVLSGWKKRLLYSGTAIAAFFVFALPVTIRIKVFWSWISDLFMHSGQYGKGDSNIINWGEFIANTKALYGEGRIFFFVLFILIGLTAFVLLFKKIRKSNALLYVSIAVIAAVLIQIVIVCKHFEYRYFVPAAVLLPFMFILISEITSPFHLRWRQYKLSFLAIYVFLLFYAVKQQPVIESLSIHLDQEFDKRMPARNYMQTLEKDAVLFLIPGFYGCPAVEYALMSSYGWAGKQKELFKPVLGKLYPNTYIYYFWDKTLNFWADEPNLNFSERPVYVYMEHINHKDVFLEDMKKYFPADRQLEQRFFNAETNEVVYQLVRLDTLTGKPVLVHSPEKSAAIPQ